MVYQCSSCGKKFQIRGSLSWHRMKSACGNKVTDSYYLSRYNGTSTVEKQYKAEVLAVDRPHTCETCGKAFIHANNLEAHRKLHKQNKSFPIEHITYEQLFKNSCNLPEENFNHVGNKSFNNCTYGQELASNHVLKEEILQTGKFTSLYGPLLNKRIKTEYVPVKNMEKFRPYSELYNSVAENENFQTEDCASSVTLPLIKREDCVEEVTVTVPLIKREVCVEEVLLPNHASVNKDIKYQTFTDSWNPSFNKPIKTESTPHEDEEENILGIGTSKVVIDVGKGASTNTNLLPNKQMERVDRANKCDICQKQFIHICNLKVHKTLAHKGSKQTVHKTNQSPDDSKVQAGVNPHQCNICQKELENGIDLPLHNMTHVVIDNPYRCDTCDESFNHNTSLKAHKQMHTVDDPKALCCENCGKWFIRPNDLTRHKRIYAGERFKCSICSKEFRHACSLYLHSLKHKGPKCSGYNYKCKICSKRFKRLPFLQRHNILAHTTWRLYECYICSKSFKYLHRLKRHISSHEGDNPQSDIFKLHSNLRRKNTLIQFKKKTLVFKDRQN